MAIWSGEKIVYFTDRKSDYWPGWLEVDCGCCNGLEWGGEEPIECLDCGESGVIYKHEKSGVLAQYPGGPFLGKD